MLLLRSFILIVLGFGLVCCRDAAKSQSQGSAAVTTPASSERTEGPSIVFLGDSLTAGRGLDESQSLPALVQVKLDAASSHYRVINAGRSGDTTAGGLARLDWYLRKIVNPHILVIGLGSNDAMRGLELSAMEANLRQIIQKARQFRPELKVLLWELETFPNLGPDYGSAYKALFRRVAKEEDAILIPFPLAGVAGTLHLNQDDGVHPNAEGTVIVANNIWRALKPLL